MIKARIQTPSQKRGKANYPPSNKRARSAKLNQPINKGRRRASLKGKGLSKFDVAVLLRHFWSILIRIRMLYINNKYMTESIPVSQLSLLKIDSQRDENTSKVFFDLNGALQRVELPFNGTTTISDILTEVISRADNWLGQTSPCPNALNLYAAKRNGRRMSDLPSYEPSQRIQKTGQKNFYLSLSGVIPKNLRKNSQASTRALRSEMEEPGKKLKGDEIKVKK